MKIDKILPKIGVSFKPKRSCKNRMYVHTSNEVAEILMNDWNQDTIHLFEEFKVLFLDRRNGVIGIRNLNRGTQSSTIVDIKLILSIALTINCQNLIISHNHPSGQIKPSEHDNQLTKKIVKACKAVDLKLLDHIILGSDDYYSYADNNFLD